MICDIFLTFFEKLFCTATIHITRLNIAYISVNGPFSYRRLSPPILPGEPILSPCYDTIIYPHSIQLPLRPLAPSHTPAYSQALSLATGRLSSIPS